MTRKLLFPMVLVCSLFCSCAEDNMATLKKRGLMGRVTYRVVDEAGSPVTNASVQVAFQSNSSKSKLVRGVTDTNGMFTAEARVQFRANAQFTKNGYYRSSHEYMFFTIDQSKMKAGKWLPWNPTLDITLFPIKKPHITEKNFKLFYHEHLEQDTAYGFDMLKGDIVLPGKKGEAVDFQFRGKGIYKIGTEEENRETNIFYTNDLEIVFLNEGDGVVRRERRKDSEFQFTYHAPETGYEQKVSFHSDYSRRAHVSTFPSNDEYLIFRISRKDVDSDETRRYYGIITRFCGGTNTKGERSLDIEYYLNSTPEDRNIE